MSFLETIACNSHEELTDWLGFKIGELLNLHANHMANTLPLMEEVPLHPFLATGLAKAILGDCKNSMDFEIGDLAVYPENVGVITFPLEGMATYPDNMLDELVKLARA